MLHLIKHAKVAYPWNSECLSCQSSMTNWQVTGHPSITTYKACLCCFVPLDNGSAIVNLAGAITKPPAAPPEVRCHTKSKRLLQRHSVAGMASKFPPWKRGIGPIQATKEHLRFLTAGAGRLHGVQTDTGESIRCTCHALPRPCSCTLLSDPSF